MSFKIKGFGSLVLHSIPSLLAIGLLSIVNVEVYIHGPISKGSLYLIGWLVIQMIPGFLFGYISDLNHRKRALVISQLFGLVGGSFLFYFGFQNWILVLIALTFNPTPVARAAFLDYFPNYSILKVLAITFLPQHLPWVFFDYLAKIPPNTIIFSILIALAVNVIFTILFFKKDSSKPHGKHPRVKIRNIQAITLMLCAFTLSESSFYLIWSYLEENISLHSWQAIATFGTVIGLAIALFYKRLPHISIITLFYSIGAGVMLSVLFRCFSINGLCQNSFLNAMSYYTIIGGIYLPFVASAVIDMFGPTHRAIGSAGDKTHKYAVYPNYETGLEALIVMLKGSIYSPLTLRAAIKRYDGTNPKYIDAIVKITKLDPERTIKSLSDHEFKSFWKAIESIENWAVGKEDFIEKWIISGVHKKRGVITEYLININTGQNWISKQEAIKLSLEGKLRATIFHRKAGTYYLRPEYGSKSFELII